jgi:hypothetical protein
LATFRSSGAKFLAKLWKGVKRPSHDIPIVRPSPLRSSPCRPSAVALTIAVTPAPWSACDPSGRTLTRTVVPSRRLCTKRSANGLVWSSTRSVARLSNATTFPSAEIAGSVEELSGSPPLDARDARVADSA